MTPSRPGRLPLGRLQLGWQYAMAQPEPGPPPRRPTPPEAERLSPDWIAAQRRAESQVNRPLKAAFLVAVVLGVVLVALGAAGSLGTLVTGLGVTCCALVAVVSGYALWQGERALRSRMAEERARVDRRREAQESQLFAWQAEHAAQMQAWQARQLAYERQKRWYAVRLPEGVHRVDIAGGTASGWSAMLTTAAASQLPAGGEVTVLDLTGSAAALDLLGFARATGIDPLVLVLPDDLPRLDLGRGLGREALAELLSAVAGAAGEPQADRDPPLDHAILERVVDVLAGQAAIAAVAAGLLALAGDPADDVAAGLITAAQADRLAALAGRDTSDHAVLERAWVLESRLRKLASAGTGAVPRPRSRLRVVALDRRVGTVSGRVLGTYLAAALTHQLRAAPPGTPWQHTLFVLGADKLRGDILDQLGDACERSATGLVLACQGIPAPARPRPGHAAVAFMRLAGADDAAAASEQLGRGQRFVLAQLTETIGAAVADTADGTYTSTAGTSTAGTSTAGTSTAGTSTGGTSTGGTSTADAGSSDSEPVSAEIRTSTGWGMATAKATADSESLARARPSSREFPADPDELQQLPASAMIISYAAAGGRPTVLIDVNPGIGGLGTATQVTVEESRAQPADERERVPAPPHDDDASSPEDAPAAPLVPGRPAPNLGPPPRRLDWRRGRS